MQSSSQIITTNKPTPNILQARCLSCCRTNSDRTLKGKLHLIHLIKVHCYTQTVLTASLLHPWFSLSILMAIFPGERGLDGVYWSKGWWKWWWQLELQDMQISSQIVITNQPTPKCSVAYILQLMSTACWESLFSQCHKTNWLNGSDAKFFSGRILFMKPTSRKQSPDLLTSS